MKTVKRVLLALVLGLATSCDVSYPELDIVLERDYTEVIQAINDANKSLTDKLTLIDAAVSNKMAGNLSLLELVQGALASMGGTQEEKLAAVQAAVSARSTSLETKLALVEAVVQGGFAETQAQQTLLGQAIESLAGSAEERLSAVEAAVTTQTTSFDTRLGLIDAAVKKGLADSETARDLIGKALDATGKTLEEKLAAIEMAVKDGETSLRTKLDLLNKAMDNGLVGHNAAFVNLMFSLTALGDLDDAQQETKTELLSQFETLSEKLSTEELAKVFKQMADAVENQQQSEEELLSTLLTVVGKLADALTIQYELTLVDDPAKVITVTQGSDICVRLRVNPAETVLKKDSLQVQVVSHKYFYPVGESVGTDSDHFSVRSLEADPAVAGQYVATISTKTSGTVWDESVLSLVYNFGNKKKAKYVGTTAFPVTLMPRAKDALDRRFYPNGSFLMRLPLQDLEMGKLYYALGRRSFSTEDGKEKRTYSADNITRARFIQPDKPDTASVFTELDSRHFVRFSPDTVGNLAWRNFQRHYIEDHLSQEVTGQLALTDRWGATDSIPLSMKWYVTWPIIYEIVDTTNVRKPSDFVPTSEGYVYKFPEIWPKLFNPWGLDFETIQSSGAELERTHFGSGDGYMPMILMIPEDSAASAYLLVEKNVKPVSGDKLMSLGTLCLRAKPSDEDPTFCPAQIYYDYQIKIKVIDE